MVLALPENSPHSLGRVDEVEICAQWSLLKQLVLVPLEVLWSLGSLFQLTSYSSFLHASRESGDEIKEVHTPTGHHHLFPSRSCAASRSQRMAFEHPMVSLSQRFVVRMKPPLTAVHTQKLRGLHAYTYFLDA